VAELSDPVLRVVLGYLLGSVVGSLAIGRCLGVDIREQGSGNAGGTNALRTQGKAFALGVVVIDVGKGWLAARVLPTLPLPFVPAAGASAWMPCLCAFAAIVGHVWPLWHGLRGGKGAATLLGALGGLGPLLLVPVAVAWLVMVMVAGFVGLATMTASAVVPLAVDLLALEPARPLMAFALASTVLIVFTHRGNIRRMRAGTEPRARRLWLLGRAAR
jgi:glycerol-3-phosphate acyltransferase PlsY